MALPKEPRQKMINFMYLVLTAMLALNVSSEILHAFKVVDESMLKSNGVVTKSSTDIVAQLDAAQKGTDAANAAKAAIWKPKADSALKFTNDLIAKIEAYKAQLISESNPKTEDGVTTYSEDNLDAATRIFATKGEGEVLRSALEKFKTDVVSVLPEANKAKIAPQIPIDTKIPEDKGEKLAVKSWAEAYFHMTPTIAAVTMLSKFQNDVLRSGNIVANHCLEQLGKVEIIMNKFEAIVSQNSEYLLPGQELTIRAGLGAFSTTNLPTVSFNGAGKTVDAGTGYAEFKTTAQGGGEQTVNVSVSFKNPNTGATESRQFPIKYTVGTPSGASVFLQKMNVMYKGVPNPVTISAGSIKAENMKVSFSKGSITRSGGDNWVANVSETGEGAITISGDGKTFTFPIRCKRLPPPTPMVGTLKSGKVPSAVFKAQGGVRAVLEDSEFQAGFTISGYTIGGFVNGEPRESVVNGPSFAGNPIVTSAKPGSSVGIYNIRAKGPDGSDYKLGDLFFILQ